MSEKESYDQYAKHCRKMAAKMKVPKHREQLEEMADAWTFLANEEKVRAAETP